MHTLAHEKLDAGPLVLVVGGGDCLGDLVVGHVDGGDSINLEDEIAGAQLAALVGGALFLWPGGRIIWRRRNSGQSIGGPFAC